MLTFGSGDVAESMHFDASPDARNELERLLDRYARIFQHNDDELCAPWLLRLAVVVLDRDFFPVPAPARDLATSCPHRIAASFRSAVIA